MTSASAAGTARRVPGLLLVAAGIACALEASTFDVAFLTDPVGPKALPYLVAAILVGAGVHAAWRPRPGVEWPGVPTLLRIGAAAAAFVAYSAALPFLGFFTSTTLAVATLARLFGAGWTHALAASAGLSGALWLTFVLGLGLPLPIGELWIR